MSTILDKIVEKTRQRVFLLKKEKSLDQLLQIAQTLDKGDFPFEKALAQKDISFICEVKKASPSKGMICENFSYVQTAIDYEKAGASAISVLTEPYFFLGSDRYLSEISQKVSIPLLRKDFIIDEYQIYEAKVIGADAILLICSILSDEQLHYFLEVAESLGLSALVEAHNEDELNRALKAKARIIGINNRDLRTFEVDINHGMRLRHLVPSNILFVSESGIKTPQDVQNLRENNVDAALIGETFMRAKDKTKALKVLKGESF